MERKLDSGYTISYSNGKLSQQEQTNALNMIKLIRYIAGLSDDIYLYDEYNDKAQASVEVNFANGTLSHYPVYPDGLDDRIANLGINYSQDCNLAKYNHDNVSMKYTILDGWMDDADDVNLPSLGHRRWILNPKMGMLGFGSKTAEDVTYSAMYVKDNGNAVQNQTGVCWPAANMPVSFFNPNAPWSVSLDRWVNAESISVKLVRDKDGKTWNFSSANSDGDFYVSNLDYGQTGCIIFRPNDINEYKAGDSFYVSILGAGEEIDYTVDFFDLEGYYAVSTPKIKSVTLNSLNKPVIKWSSSYGATSYSLYRRVANGEWKLLKSKIKSTSYTDSSAGKGLKYYYAVASLKEVDGAYYTSKRSSELAKPIPMSKVTISSAYAKAKKKNYISWKSQSKATGYKVYRRVYGTSTWKLLKTTEKTNFTNTSVTSGKRYQYRVRSFRTYEGYTVYGPYSVVKTIKTK